MEREDEIAAMKREWNHDSQGRKAFFYLSGLTEGTESIAVLILICLAPDYFECIAYVFSGLCWLTTLGRTLQAAARDFGDDQ